MNDEKIRTSTQLLSLLQRARVGSVVTFDVWRKGESVQLKATIAESGAAAQSPAPTEKAPEQGRTRDPEEILQALGIEVRDLSVPERMRGFRGVVATALAANGLAANLLQPGDLIVAVNNMQVSGASEFFQHLASSAAVQDTVLLIIREGKSQRVTLPALPRKE